MTELKTILHVDDDEDILEITRMALQLVDKFELHQCSSGRRAGASLTGMDPDLILLDVMMPGDDGARAMGSRSFPDGRRGIPGDLHDSEGGSRISAKT
jgi:CheY-like chemotaxis protein